MLVLARRLNERVIIPCIDAAIQVVGFKGGLSASALKLPPT